MKDIIIDKSLCSNLIPGMFRSTSGIILEKAQENNPCCLHHSILTSEDGTNSRWPLVTDDDSCVGGGKQTFQQWLDEVADTSSYHNNRLCFDGWLYVNKGI